MKEYLRTNQTALRACIYYQFVSGKSVHESYKNLCERIGDDMIKYVDFEYWFMRFTNGEFDFDNDKSLDSKTRSLPDMPIHIFEKIIKKLELMDRLTIGRVSKNFQYIIDDWNPGFKKIRIDIDENKKYLYYDEKCVVCKKDPEYHFVCDGKKKKPTHLAVEYGQVDSLASVLKNPKLHLNEFEVNYLTKEYFNKFESWIQSSNRKIHVKKLMIKSRYPQLAMAILPCLEAGTLREIVLHTRSMKTDETKRMMDRIVELEQFKKLQMLTIITNNNSDLSPIKSFLECRRLTIEFHCRTCKKTLHQFTNTLLNSTVLKVAIFKSNRIFRPNLEQLGRRSIEVPGRPNVRRFPIPESNEFFEVEVRRKSICIKRIS